MEREDICRENAEDAGEEKESPETHAFAFWVKPNFFVGWKAADEMGEEADDEVEKRRAEKDPDDAAHEQERKTSVFQSTDCFCAFPKACYANGGISTEKNASEEDGRCASMTKKDARKTIQGDQRPSDAAECAWSVFVLKHFPDSNNVGGGSEGDNDRVKQVSHDGTIGYSSTFT